MIFRYRRYFGVVVTHYTAMVYSARYAEMVEVLGQTLFYLNPNAPVQLDSPLSDLPCQVKVLIWWLIPSKCALDLIQHSLFSYEWPPLLNIHVLWPYSVRIVIYFCYFVSCVQRILANDMPTLCIFNLLRETDEEFIQRTGWTYQPLSPVYGIDPNVQVLEPFRRHPRGGAGSGAGLGGGHGVTSG